MVIGTSSTDSSSMPSMASWLAKLQENAKSEEDLLMGVVKSTSKQIQEAQDKALEKAKQAAQESDDTEGSTQTTKTASSDEIKAPEEVTAQDLESPIDIKL